MLTAHQLKEVTILQQSIMPFSMPFRVYVTSLVPRPLSEFPKGSGHETNPGHECAS